MRGLGGDDSIIGGGGADFIYGARGNDDLQGYQPIPSNAQYDESCGGDRIAGGDGNDRITNFYNSTVYGGDGDDYIERGYIHITGGPGGSNSQFENKIYGGAGNDTIYAGSGTFGDDGFRPAANGGEGNDSMYGGERSMLFGGAGEDTVVGGNGSFISGGDGNDVLTGAIFNGGSVTINGGAGDDFISVSGFDRWGSFRSTHDVLRGGDGNDTINGGLGEDTLSGGLGEDTFIFNAMDFRHSGFGVGGPAQGVLDFTARIQDFDVSEDTIQYGRMIHFDAGAFEPYPSLRLVGAREMTVDDILKMLESAETIITNGVQSTVLYSPGDFSNTTITLVGVAASDLTLDNFTIV